MNLLLFLRRNTAENKNRSVMCETCACESVCEGELMITVQSKPPEGAVFICINLLFISDTFLNNSLFMNG